MPCRVSALQLQRYTSRQPFKLPLTRLQKSERERTNTETESHPKQHQHTLAVTVVYINIYLPLTKLVHPDAARVSDTPPATRIPRAQHGSQYHGGHLNPALSILTAAMAAACVRSPVSNLPQPT